MMGFGMMGGGLFGIVIIGVVIYLLLNNNGSFRHDRNIDSSTNNALDILNERYAKGELSEEEYLKKKQILRD